MDSIYGANFRSLTVFRPCDGTPGRCIGLVPFCDSLNLTVHHSSERPALSTIMKPSTVDHEINLCSVLLIFHLCGFVSAWGRRHFCLWLTAFSCSCRRVGGHRAMRGPKFVGRHPILWTSRIVNGPCHGVECSHTEDKRFRTLEYRKLIGRR